jgi:hypothetical protein
MGQFTAGASGAPRPQSVVVDSVDLDSLAWRAVELAVQRRHDPRLIVATRPTIVGPTSTARLVAGLCNAAAGRRAIALFGVDGTDVVGVDVLPDHAWLATVAARFPGVVPTMSTATIDADGARIVAVTADDPGTLVAAMRSGRVVIPWFDGTLTDRPPMAGDDRAPARPAGRIEVRSGWLERTGPCTMDPAVPTTDTDSRSGLADTVDRAASADETGSAGTTDTDSEASNGSGVVVWRGVLDIALALDTLTVGSGADEAGAAVATAATADTGATSTAAEAAGTSSTRAPGSFESVAADSTPTGDTGAFESAGPRGFAARYRRGIAIADRDVSVTLLADGSSVALSLDVEVHPTPGAAAAARSDGGVVLDAMLPCRLYLAAAAGSAVFDRHRELGGSVRLLVSLRFPGDDRLVATMATLGRDTAAPSQRWTL